MIESQYEDSIPPVGSGGFVRRRLFRYIRVALPTEKLKSTRNSETHVVVALTAKIYTDFGGGFDAS